MVNYNTTIAAEITALQSYTPTSCQQVLVLNPSAASGMYNVTLLGVTYPVWCQMINGVGWALLLKIDGSKSTFPYTSALWTTTTTLNPSAVSLGLDNTEFKSPLYSVFPFTKLLLGMKNPVSSSTVNWATMPVTQSSSLYSVISSGSQMITSGPTRAQMEAMVGIGSLQPYCNLVGINLSPSSSSYTQCSYIRIGYIANEQNDCTSPDSYIGFGGQYTGSSSLLSSGNYCASSNQCDNSGSAGSNIPTFGYILAN